MRNVNPDDLDQLAKLFDGRGGVQDKLDEAFARASRLGVSGKLTAVKPLRTWVSDTAPDLRKRAAIARLEDGDPEAGLRWAGFDPKDIVKAGVYLKAPGVLLIANAMAISGDSKADAFRRKSRESLDDWVDRLRAHGVAQIPALTPYEKEIAEILGDVGDITSTIGHGGTAAFHSVNLTKVLVGNSLAQGFLKTKKFKAAAFLRWLPMRYSWMPARVGAWGRSLQKVSPVIRSLSAPGQWLPSKLGALASGSATFQRASGLPVLGTRIGQELGIGYDLFMRSGLMTNSLVGRFSASDMVTGLVGSDKVAKMYGGLTHAGQIPGRAAQASLWKVAKNVYADERLFGSGRLAAMGKGLKFAGKASGALRAAGVVGGLASTGYSVANVWVQGKPAAAFKKKGAGYVADVAEIGFNASLTAATVAPNPFTVGAVAVTGAVYAGAKVVEHWDDIKKGAGKAADWVGNKAKDLGKSLAKSKVNPMNWF
ncbi:PE-PGRS family protein [Streptomyces sp. NBC_00847]|uniref:PE-PGRS family protein n=1 Tax=Streptomyces sp. NBC_00847 TaxID=2975850 RepID=UPI00225B1A8B|nr:PE-PGRS family protein [Streptomyces sp. NBC_00847]MCX4882785.1 PE-PGRS family protein [Streptomyces sp. NBC_00847]